MYILLDGCEELCKIVVGPGRHVLWIMFDDLVSDPTHWAGQIFDFLGLDAAAWAPKHRFFPEKSRKRIGKWQHVQGAEKADLFAQFDTIAQALGYDNHGDTTLDRRYEC